MPSEIEFKVQPRDGNRAFLVVKCPHTAAGECRFSMWQGEAGGAMWHWDGNVEVPTVTPSIDCQGGCGRHFTVVKGKPVS